MDFQLTTQQKLLRSQAREFARQAVSTRAAYYDREATFPWEIFHQAREQGLLHLSAPTSSGGKGLGILEQVIVSEELAWGCTGICAALSLNNLALSALLIGGTPEQQQHYFPRLLAGELCSFAVTETTGGSDIGALRTKATLVEQNGRKTYALNGSKTWISNAPDASFFILFARTSPAGGPAGISAFLIERNTPGLSIGASQGKLGQHAAPTAEIFLEDVRVPSTALLGALDEGFALAMHVFDRSRPQVAAYGVGLIQRCLDEALVYAKKRKAMGKPIIEHQAIGNKIAEMGMKLEAARLLTYQAAWLCDCGESNALQAAYAKAFAADTAMWAASETLQIFGGAGYSTDLPIEKLFRDAKLLQIYEGSSEIQRTIMKRELARPSVEEQ
ncbi:MAG TPA: acyl-CoA dehydrogenase family protein [Ktedonobacteraceae bacterium]|nr:acyl-CoA dehydrogenase family protein [Ktedonobacteraceae bacterium]